VSQCTPHGLYGQPAQSCLPCAAPASLALCPPHLQERFFVLQRGLLTYYESQDDWEKGHEPIKGLRISVKYYKVDP